MDRATKARALVDEFIDRRASGKTGNEQDLIDAHRDLMPELGDQLHMMHLIDGAASRVQAPLGEEAPAGESETTFARATRSSGPPRGLIPGYELIEPVHRGGQGVVYRATHEATRRQVAIKVAREGPFAGPREQARFEREVHILAALNHPNIVTIHDSGTAAGQFYYAMDFIDGTPLDTYVAKHGPPIGKLLLLFETICDAVNAAHLRGVIHRDLKPGNILIDAKGKPSVLDFGLAKIADTNVDDADQLKTVTGQFVGTIPWAAPEQVEGSPDRIDLRTDVYSLGVILYHMLTARFPYSVVGNVRDVFDQISRASPTRPSTLNRRIDNEIETILLKCLSKEPDRRYQSAGALAADLRRYRQGHPIEAKADSTWYVLRKTVQRHRVPAMVASGFIILAVGFGIGMSALYHRASREAEQSRRLADCLQLLFRFPQADLHQGQLSVTDLLDRHAETVARELADLPEAQAGLIETIARTYMVFKQADRALPWLHESVRLNRDVLASDDQSTARSMVRLAYALARNGKHEQAQLTFEEAVELLRASMNSPDPLLASVLMSYSNFLGYHMGDLEAGLTYRKESLAILRELTPPNIGTLASTVYAMGGYVHDMGQFKNAEGYYLEALALYEQEGIRGGSSGFRRSLGLLYKDMGRYDDAELLLRKVVEDEEAVHGKDDQALGTPYMSLAKLYADAHRPEEALAPCKSSIRIFTDQYGQDHEVTSEPMTLLGRILIQMKEYSKAERVLRKAHVTREAVLPRLNWERAKTATLLGASLAGLERFEEAEPLLLENYPIIRDNRGPAHRRTFEAAERVMHLYRAWHAADPDEGYDVKAAEWRAKLPNTAPD